MSAFIDPQQNVQSIIDWLEGGGGKLHPAVEVIYSDDATGYHLRVRQGGEIIAGEQVISCPKLLTMSILSMATAGFSWPGRFMSYWSHSLEVLTRFFLIEQYLMSEYSFWYPYIRMLPQPNSATLDTPMYYSHQDCLWIKGTNMERARRVREDQWRSEYYRSLELLISCDHARYTMLYNQW